jgi:hypothetical protein
MIARQEDVKSMALPPDEREAQARRRIADIRNELARIELICSGTLLERTKVCGKPNCRCATDPDARHGPYFEWSHRVAGSLRHKILSPEQARQLRQAIDNHRDVQQLLDRWEHESAAIILGRNRRKR